MEHTVQALVWAEWANKARRDFGLRDGKAAAFWRYLALERGGQAGCSLADRAIPARQGHVRWVLWAAMRRAHWPPDTEPWCEDGW